MEDSTSEWQPLDKMHEMSMYRGDTGLRATNLAQNDGFRGCSERLYDWGLRRLAVWGGPPPAG